MTGLYTCLGTINFFCFVITILSCSEEKSDYSIISPKSPSLTFKFY